MRNKRKAGTTDDSVNYYDWKKSIKLNQLK